MIYLFYLKILQYLEYFCSGPDSLITIFYWHFLKIRVDHTNHTLGLCEGLLKSMHCLSIAYLVRPASDDVIPGMNAVYRQFLLICLGH